jgi:hypothetical protein
MRHYVDLPRRLPSARSIARTRSRALPILLALPLVAILWVTIGLPIISTATTASVSDRRARDVVFQGAFGSHSGSHHGSTAQTISVSTFLPAVLRAVGINPDGTPVVAVEMIGSPIVTHRIATRGSARRIGKARERVRAMERADGSRRGRST